MDITKPQPLTYGVIRKNQPVVDALTSEGFTIAQRIEASVAFLKLAFPEATEEDFDALSPIALQVIAGDLWKATFARPEETAPAPQNP